MIKCPKCETIYRKDAPDNCIFCKADLKVEKEKESKEEQKDTLLVSNMIKCSKCSSENLELRLERNLHTGFIRCKDCGNIDTREFVDGKTTELTKCDLCGSTTTEIQTINGYSEPLWTYAEFDYIDNMTLCQKCFEDRYEELEEKEEEMKYKKPIIEYMFDGDELKYWLRGDIDNLLGEVEVNNDNGKSRYKKALKEMKDDIKMKFPDIKKIEFVDIDEE